MEERVRLMAISKGIQVAEPDRQIVLALDDYKDGRVHGTITHKSIDQPVEYNSLMDMAWIVENILDGMKFAQNSLEQRSFANFKTEVLKGGFSPIEKQGSAAAKGKIATFHIRVQHRYFATWQGYAVWEEEGETKPFRSFLELVWILESAIRQKEPQNWDVSDDATCRVLVDGSTDRDPKGWIYHPAALNRVSFNSMMHLMQYLRQAVASRKDRDQSGYYFQEEVVSEEAFGKYRLKGKKATFVIQVCFEEHNTWQGVIYWKEERQREKFRSFLELVKLMDLAVAGASCWRAEEPVEYEEAQ